MLCSIKPKTCSTLALVFDFVLLLVCCSVVKGWFTFPFSHTCLVMLQSNIDCPLLVEFSFRESGRQLLLMGYLQRIVNGCGKVEREMALVSGRCDLLIEYAGERFVVELKINYDSYSFEDGKDQVSRYLDKLGLEHGYLMLFETKKSDVVTWEQRLKWTELEHEWRGVKKQISLVGM